jgi:hypothetical protein
MRFCMHECIYMRAHKYNISHRGPVSAPQLGNLQGGEDTFCVVFTPVNQTYSWCVYSSKALFRSMLYILKPSRFQVIASVHAHCKTPTQSTSTNSNFLLSKTYYISRTIFPTQIHKKLHPEVLNACIHTFFFQHPTAACILKNLRAPD